MKYLTQQQKILKLLQESPNGVNSYDLTYRYSIKQAPTRIKELREQGYLITSERMKNQSVQYHLHNNSEPITQELVKERIEQAWERKDQLIRVEHPDGHVTWEEPKDGEQLSM